MGIGTGTDTWSALLGFGSDSRDSRRRLSPKCSHMLRVCLPSSLENSLTVDRRFGPTPLRGRMLTLVFMCQPLGQLAATLIALIAAVRQRNGIPSDATVTQCTRE